MIDVRCGNCGKLLFKAEGNFKIEIKCNKCKQISNFDYREEGKNNG